MSQIQKMTRMARPGMKAAAIPSTTTNSCLGIPVRYDLGLKVLVDSRGIWRWKEIVVGPGFFMFPPREQQAMLLHEVGHCKMNHVAKLLWFVVRSPARLYRFLECGAACARAGQSDAQFFEEVALRMPDVAAYRKAQEFAADRFAAACGYGHDLARAFSRVKPEGGPFHPHPAERAARLLGAA